MIGILAIALGIVAVIVRSVLLYLAAIVLAIKAYATEASFTEDDPDGDKKWKSALLNQGTGKLAIIVLMFLWIAAAR